MPEHLTPNMIRALKALDNLPDEKREGLTTGEVGQHLDIRYSKGSYMGQPKVFGRGAAAASICRALVRRGLVREAIVTRYGELETGWQITASGCAKLSEVSSTLSS